MSPYQIYKQLKIIKALKTKENRDKTQYWEEKHPYIQLH